MSVFFHIKTYNIKYYMLSLTKIIQLLYKRDNIYYYTYSVFIIILFFVIITLILYWGFLYFMFKIKSRFWSIQPVYHLYDFHYFFYKPQIIMNELPQKNTYIDFKNTKYIINGEKRRVNILLANN